MEEKRFITFKNWWLGLSGFIVLALLGLWLLSTASGLEESIIFLISAVWLAIVYGLTYYFGIARRGPKFINVIGLMSIMGIVHSVRSLAAMEDVYDWVFAGISIVVQIGWIFCSLCIAKLNKERKKALADANAAVDQAN